jgi:transposase
MAHFHIKKKKGRPYLYVREIARVGGRPKVVSQIYIGSPARVAALAAGQEQEDLRLKVEEFGSLWLAQQMDRDIDLAAIVDDVVKPGEREKGPSVGEYFLYAVWNRMIEAVSKRQLPDWYGRTAVQQIRPVAVDELTSQRYWEKWDRVSQEEIDEISRRFFARICEVEAPAADCLLFDTTNYYTFIDGQTESELAIRAHNKAGRHQLRQIGLGLLVARGSRLPLYYKTYPGNLHDSRLFAELMEEMFSLVCGLERTKERLTVVVDKGMNSEANFVWLDEHPRMHFVATYSTYYAEELAATALEWFEPVETAKNRRLTEDGHPEERLLAYRTLGEFWGKERAVVVTYNPASARKQLFTLGRKLDDIRDELLVMRAKVRAGQAQWRDPDVIRERCVRICEGLHIRSDLYDLEFTEDRDGLAMSFRRNAYRVEQHRVRCGKTIIITDNTDWTTTEIVEASLDRWQVEDAFRRSKDKDLVGVQPIRHWTDSKIRCHFFTCVAALTYLRRLELQLARVGVNRSAAEVMKEMRHLHSVLLLPARARKPRRRLETPTKTQAEVLSALGWVVTKGGVLQRAER